MEIRGARSPHPAAEVQVTASSSLPRPVGLPLALLTPALPLRPYLVNLLPCLTRISRRPEETVQETLATAIPKLMAALGNFANDNEIKVRQGHGG